MSRVASPRRSPSRSFARVLSGGRPAVFPSFVAPCLASLRTKVPTARGFVHELKLDGYRVQAHLRDGRVTLYTRSGDVAALTTRSSAPPASMGLRGVWVVAARCCADPGAILAPTLLRGVLHVQAQRCAHP